MWPVKIILHPSDFSEDSQRAFEFACQMAGSTGGKVMVLHVHQPDVVAMGDMPPIPVEIENEEESRHKLLAIHSSIPDVAVEHLFLTGSAVECIISTAQTRHADLIVMGSHGRTGLKRLLLGSVADHVLRRAPCPVLVVPPPKVK